MLAVLELKKRNSPPLLSSPLNDAQLMSFFREIVAKKAGAILSKDILLKAPVPLGAQTLAQVYQGWARSMKRLKKKKKIAVTKDNPDVMPIWKVDVLEAED